MGGAVYPPPPFAQQPLFRGHHTYFAQELRMVSPDFYFFFTGWRVVVAGDFPACLFPIRTTT
jgi:hypothetical protein